MDTVTAMFTMATAVAALGYTGVCGYVAHRFTRAIRKTPGMPGDLDDLAQDQVHFPSRDGRASIAAWYLPAKPRSGAVIFVHGKDACRGGELKSSTLQLARRLNAAGLSVLMLDLRGHGTSSAARLTYGARERNDVLGAVDYLLERGYATTRIGVIGASLGGSTSLMAAAIEPAIGAVMADSPFADFNGMIGRHFKKLSGLPGCFLPGALAIARLLTGENLRAVRPIDHATQLKGRPVLIVHGASDPFIPADHGASVAQAAGAELWLTNSASHLGSFREQPAAYAAKMIDFFVANLLPPVPAQRLAA